MCNRHDLFDCVDIWPHATWLSTFRIPTLTAIYAGMPFLRRKLREFRAKLSQALHQAHVSYDRDRSFINSRS